MEKLLFYIGSVLGIIAFLRPFYESGFESNQEKWKKIQEKLTEDDLYQLQIQVYVNSMVDPKLLNKVRDFGEDIENDLEYIRLGFPFKRKFDIRKNNIIQLYNDLRKYIQTPYWYREKSSRVFAINYWNLDKDYFEKEFNKGHLKYHQHLKEASDIVDEIRVNYRAMSYLVNLNLIQIPFAKHIVEKRSKLPAK